MSGMEPLLALQLASAAGQTGLSIMGQRQANKVQDQATEYEINGLNQRAGQERAAAQRRAEVERHKGDVLMSEQRARAAAGGGGMGGSAGEIIGATAARASLNQDMRLWEGDEAAAGLEEKARMTRVASDASKRGRGMELASTILKGVAMGASAVKGSNSPSRSFYYDTPAPSKAAYDPTWSNTRVRYG